MNQTFVAFTTCWSVLVAMGLCVTAMADTIKLKDGTVVEGNILVENEAQVTIEATYASGTITKRQTFSKADIAEIVRLAPEQKAEREMQLAYERLQKYRLDPKSSQPLGDYDHVIGDIFRSFLSQYTNSPYHKEIEEKIAGWQAERNQVAAGKMKVGGQWITTTEAATLNESQRAQKQLQLGTELCNAEKYDEAITILNRFLALSKSQELIGEFGSKWLSLFRPVSEHIGRQIKLWEGRIPAARAARERAQQQLDDTQRRIGAYGAGQLGTKSVMQQYAAGLESAQAEVMRCENRLGSLREQQLEIDRAISRLEAVAPAPPKPPPPVAQAPTNLPPPAPSVAAPTVVNETTDWLHRYWMYGAAAIVLGLWLVSRLFTKQ